jgi:drug/metabolite transporter (DMT)-like permease
MHDAETILQTYFAGEKSEAMLIMLAGAVCLAGAVLLWFQVREPFAKGLAGGLLLMAALGLVVGASVYFRTDAQVRQLTHTYQTDPATFAAREGPRIRQVVRSFGWYRMAYAAAVLAALLLVFALGQPAHHGLAVGLLLLAALGLTIDFHAERRARTYVDALESQGALHRARP